MKTTIFVISCFLFLASFSVNAQKTDRQLEIVAQLPVRPGDVAVSKSGRVFSTIHSLGSNELQLIEITGKASYKPYPSSSYQKHGKAPTAQTLDSPLGLIFDGNDHLWVTDMGQELGRTRIWCFDVNKNKVLEVIELPEAVAPKGSFIQDLAVDEKNGWAYLADINNPGIIALNLKTKEARRFGNHASLQAEDVDMVIDGKLVYFNGKPARVAIDPITLSADKETLYFGAMNGQTWYKADARLFRENASDKAIAASIKPVGKKPLSDGATTDKAGNHYFTNLTEHAITQLSADGKLTHIVQDNRLQWPDNAYLAPGGWIYITANQLNTTPAFTGGKDESKAPYFIYRVKYPHQR